MIIADLRTFLAERRRATLFDLSCHFHTDPEALRGMMGLLERRGEVRKLPTATLCGGCAKCAPAAAEAYEWIRKND